MKPTSLTHKGWGIQHLFTRDGKVEGIYLRYMESSEFTHERRSIYYFVSRFGVDNILTWIPQNLLMIDGVHNIYSRYMEFTVFSYER